MAARIRYHHVGREHPYQWLTALAGAALLALGGAASGLYLITAGHHVTGMDNQVVWGLPHVFAIALILAGSGAFAIAALAPRLAGPIGQPWGRLGTGVAVALLLGGLAILVLDLGSPQRILAAMRLNPLSSFSRNIALYTAFTAIALLHLGALIEPRMRRYAGITGGLAALVALLLALNVGSIFGMLAARPVYGGAIMMPLFLVTAVAYGTAAFSLAWQAVLRSQGQAPPAAATARLATVLLTGVIATATLLALHLLTLLYRPGLREAARFLLIDGGAYPVLFWIGAVAIGIITPTLLLLRRAARARGRALAGASGSVLAGGLAHLFVVIVGGQAVPLQALPGRGVAGAGFDEEAASYVPTAWEALLGIGGVGLAAAILLVALRVLPLTASHLPEEATPMRADSQLAAHDGTETGEPAAG